MNQSESGRKLATKFARIAGPQAPDAVRASGSRLLKQCVRQAPVMAATLAVVTLGGVATTVLMPSVLGVTIDAVINGTELARALVVLAILFGAATVVDALDGLIAAYYGSSLTANLRHRLVGHALTLGVPGQRRFRRVTCCPGLPSTQGHRPPFCRCCCRQPRPC